MPRYQSLGKRDSVEADIVKALKKVGCDVERGTDVDLFVSKKYGPAEHSWLMEIKVPGQESNLTALQLRLKAIFPNQYIVVSSVESALQAVGVRL